MKSFWKLFTDTGDARGTRTGRNPDYPNTFDVAATADAHRPSAVRRPQLFDPALRQFSRAFRLGDPRFADEGLTRRWHAARRQAARHVLRLIARSPFSGNLVLRGSSLMTAWLGEVAREPRDLDWVVRPATIGPRDAWAEALFAGIVRTLTDQPLTAGAGGYGDLVTFQPDEAAADDIWTYDRVPGRRVVLPWRAGALPAGAVQVDVVFGERLWTPPRRRVLPGDAGQPDAVVWGADMPQSLAWKLLWLMTDQYPQGKDLYDAVLLAERTTLPAGLLRHVVEAADPKALRYLGADWPMNCAVEWQDFTLEYPWVTGPAETWLARLAAALGPTLAELRSAAAS